MGFYDDEFYNEPSEFDMQVDEFKQSLMNAVKDEFKAEMERLRKENAGLQEIKKNFEQIKREYANKERQLEIERGQVVQQVRREKLKQLLEDYQIIMWTVTSRREIGPKCDKCDERRRITYLTPMGRTAQEDCKCAEGTLVYVPQENLRVEFKLYDGRFIVWYKPYYDDDNGYKSGEVPKNIYEKGINFEDLKDGYWGTYFREKEDCQKFCDWLNEQKKD